MKRTIFHLGYSVLAALAITSTAHCTDWVESILGPGSPVYGGNADGTKFTPSGWFPDAQFPLVWGGTNEPNTNLSWWMGRHSGSPVLDYALTDGAWIAAGQWYSPDARGYWIQTVYRPVDIMPSLRGATVNLSIYPASDTWSSTPTTTPVVIDDNYLIGYAHIEGYQTPGSTQTNGTRTIYSIDNGKHWLKGPLMSLGLGVIDSRTNPGTPRIITLHNGGGKYSTDIATGVNGYTSYTASNFNPGNFYGTQALVWSRYLNRWLGFYDYNGSTSFQTNLTITPDFQNFAAGRNLYLDSYTTPPHAINGRGDYQTLLGGFPYASSYPQPFNMEVGQLGWLYNKSSGGLFGRAIHFIKQHEQPLTWTGGAGDNALANTANWQLTGGGSFSGFVDEANSLTFNSAAGCALSNSIPTSNRLRRITFDTGAGNYTLSGSKLEMEAAFVYVSDSSRQLYGITLNSSTPSTINNDIDVRSAALYLNSATGGVTLNLNGNIDILGTGGIVTSGAGNISISGNITDSGYSDFSTGQPEFVASVNPGRFIVDGTGTVSLSGTNTFTGRTDINSGTLQANSAGALQGSVVTVAQNNGLVLGGGNISLGGLNGSADLALGSSSLTLGNHNPPDCYPTSYAGTMSGAGSVTKTDTNTQTFTAANTYTGGTHLNGGTLLAVDGSFGTGTLSFAGGTLQALGDISASNAVQFNGSGGTINTGGHAVTLSGPVSGTATLVTTGSGSLTLNGTNTGFQGSIVVQNTLMTGNIAALGGGSFELDGGTLGLNTDLTLGGLVVGTVGGVVDTGSYTLTLTGTISVPAGVTLTKLGTGNLVWNGGTSGFHGDLAVLGGTVTAKQSGSPAVTLNDGNVTLSGARLALQPGGSGGTAVFNLAQTAGKSLAVNGAAGLFLDKGGNGSLTLNVGTFNLAPTSTLLITAAGGSGTLGLGTGAQLFVNGVSNTPAGQTYSPNLVVAGTDNVGDFATYNTSSGFAAFTGYTNHAGSYSVTSAASTEIANITGAATLSANSYAQGLRISGSNTLTMTGKTYTMNGANGQAGVLLNGGALSGGTLAFGSNAGFVYVGGTGTSISSVISGSGTVTFSGAPGTQVTLSSSRNSYSGRLTADGTTVVLPSVGSLGAGYTPFTVDGGGTLSFPNSITCTRDVAIGSGGGSIRVGSGATLNDSGLFTGTGTLHKIGPGTLQFGASNTTTGTTFVDQGVINYGYSGSVDHGSGLIVVANGTRINMQTAGGYGSTHPLQIAGTGIAGEGAVTVQGGGYTSNGVTLTGNSLIHANGPGGYYFKGTVNTQGYNLTLNGDSSILAFHGGSLRLGAGNLTVAGANGIVCDADTIASGSGALTVVTGSAMELDGTLSGISGATVNGFLTGSGGVLNTTGAISVAGGGQLAAGTVSGGTTNGAAFFTVDGNLSMDSTASYQSYVKTAVGAADNGGSASGYGQVLVTGSGTVGGTLKVVRDSAYTPATGDQIAVMLRNAGSGVFSQVSVIDGGTTTTYSGAAGTAITIGGKTGVLKYNSHDSINLSAPNTSSDIMIQF